MLVCFRNRSDAYPEVDPNKVAMGIALRQWFMEGKCRMYVLMPHKNKGQPYCSVHVLIEEVEEWCFPDDANINDFTFAQQKLPKDSPYNVGEQASEDLYYVWDDGASQHPGRARRLCEEFKDLIGNEKWEELALTIKTKFMKKIYDTEVREAKQRSWDIALIEKEVPQQPYSDY